MLLKTCNRLTLRLLIRIIKALVPLTSLLLSYLLILRPTGSNSRYFLTHIFSQPFINHKCPEYLYIFTQNHSFSYNLIIIHHILYFSLLHISPNNFFSPTYNLNFYITTILNQQKLCQKYIVYNLMKQALSPNEENMVYKQYIRQKYNKYRHQNLRMSEAMILEKIIREWGHMSADNKVKLSHQYKQKMLISPEEEQEDKEEVKVVTVPTEKKKPIRKSKQKKGKGAKKKKAKISESPSSVEETPQKSEQQKKEGNTQAREKAQISQDQSKEKNEQIEPIKRGCSEKQEIVEENMNQEIQSSHQQPQQKEKIAQSSNNLIQNEQLESNRSIQLQQLQNNQIMRQEKDPTNLNITNILNIAQSKLVNQEQVIQQKQATTNSLQALLNAPISFQPAAPKKVGKGKITEYLTFYQQKFKELTGLFPQLRSFEVTKVVKQLWINEKQEKKAKMRVQVTEKKRSHKKAPKKEKVIKQKVLKPTIEVSKDIQSNAEMKNFLEVKPYDFPEDLWIELKKDPHKFLNVSKKTS